MRIEQPTFPLSNEAFAAALRTGHGRAMQQLERHGAGGLEADVVAACLSCLTYDPQCEAERAPWLAALVKRAKLDAAVLKAIEAMAQPLSPENHPDLEQRSALLKELAAAGSNDARRLLYASLARSSDTSDVVGAEQIVALDGADGLKQVARQLGRWLQADPDFSVDDGLIAEFDESTGAEDGLAMLERAAETDADIASYLAGIRKARERQKPASPRVDLAAYTGSEIVAYVDKNPKDPCYWFRRWGAQASTEQRETVFAALLASGDAEHVKRLCRCFSKTGVPRFDGRLLRWMADADAQVQWAVVRALASITDPELRRVALHQIAEGDTAMGIALLVNNFQAGDFGLCIQRLRGIDLRRTSDADKVHLLLEELMDLCEAHPGVEALDGLLYVYEFSPCSICRRRAVKAMLGTNSAPAWVRAESAFDADPQTRALVGAAGSSSSRVVPPPGIEPGSRA